MLFFISFSLAVQVCHLQAQLADTWIIIFLSVMAVAGLVARLVIPGKYHTCCSVIAGLCLGFAYSNHVATLKMEALLPFHLEKQDMNLQVVVDSLPEDKGRYQRFRATVVSHEHLPAGQLPKALLLNWYGAPKPSDVCQHWQVTVRLKRPHGVANPGGFDYEAWLLEQGVQATGYIRQAEKIPRKDVCINSVRQSWRQFVLGIIEPGPAAWVLALTIGDKSMLKQEQRQLLSMSGTAHLFVISGLHIGLVASFFYALFMLVRRLGGGCFLPGPWQGGAALFSIAGALAYACMAGFSIPVQRALIMVLVFFSCQLLGVKYSLWFRYWLAMALVLLINPLAPLNIGFYLSFLAVFILLLATQGFRAFMVDKEARFSRYRNGLGLFVYIQLAITLGMMPLILSSFGNVSMLSPLFNLFLIPLMGLVIVPLLMLGFFAWLLGFPMDGLLQLVAQGINGIFTLVQSMLDMTNTGLLLELPFATQSIAMPVVMLTCLLLLLPRALAARPYTLVLVIALFYIEDSHDEAMLLEARFFDVGQGLSVFIEAGDKTLLYDTGSSWDNGSMFSTAVKPALDTLGVKQLDALIISHLDNDHAGGFYDVMDKLPVGNLYTSTLIDQASGHQQAPCHAGVSWQWHESRFSFLHPQQAFPAGKSNNRSCVLLIETAGKRILLTGDIERKVERQLLREGLGTIDILQAAHHGSKTSSARTFVEITRPQVVIFSSGYLSQFRHPHPDIVERFAHSGADSYVTGLQGQIHVQILVSGEIRVMPYRSGNGRYWQKLPRKHNYPYSAATSD